MNKVVSTLILALGFYSTPAQIVNHLAQNPERTARLERLMAPQQQQNKAAHKTTATYWRLKAKGDWEKGSGLGLEAKDSSLYKYSNDRGSDFMLTTNLYVSDFGMSTKVSYDTAMKYRNVGAGRQLYTKYISDYNSNQQKIKYTEQLPQGGNFNDIIQVLPTRDGNGNITRETSLRRTAGVWDTIHIVQRTFNTQNRITIDSSYYMAGSVKTPEQVTYYTYDANGNETGSLELWWGTGAWDSLNRNTNSYYTNNTLKVNIGEVYKGTAWVNSYRDSLGYGANPDFDVYYFGEMWDTLNLIWVNAFLRTRALDGSGLPVTTSTSAWNDTTSSFEPVSEINMLYDGYQNIINVSTYWYYGGVKSLTPVVLYNYHYEFYFKTSVDNVIPASGVIVYPNPATTQLNVNTQGLKDAHISLANMNGQVVKAISASSNITTMDVLGVAPGNYILSVGSADAAPAKQMVTIR